MYGGGIVRRKRIKLKPITRIILYSVVAITFFVFCENRVSTLPESFHIQNANNYANSTINEVINDELTKFISTYEIEKDSDNSLTIMEVNVQDISIFKSSLSARINEEINGNKFTFVPVGSLLNYNLLAGFGFSVPVNMHYVGYANVEIETRLLSSGINQSVYSLVAVVEADISSTSKNIRAEFISSYPLCEVYISGDVPSYGMKIS